MKDYRIDGRTQRVFVLLENDERLVYIPIKSLHFVDYEVLKDIYEKSPNDMLEVLKRTKLSNGRNALTQMEGIIQVMNKDAKTRIRKPDEPQPATTPEVAVSVTAAPAQSNEQVEEIVEAAVVKAVEAAKEELKPARKKSGPKPKNAK